MKEKNIPASGFRKYERLKSKKLIGQLFSEGFTVYNYPFRLIYLPLESDNTHPIKVMLSVSKRLYPKAHTRNRIKRLLKEAYRVEKSKLINTLNETNTSIAVAFVFRSKVPLCFEDTREHMQNALEFLEKTISEKTD